MLKISVVETPTERRILLCGKLAGLWIGELQSAWERSRQQLGSRRVVIDLNDVTSVDHAAETVLATIMKQGALFVGSGTVNRWLIQALKEGKTAAAVTLLQPGFDLERPREREGNQVTTIAEGIVTLADLRAHLLREPQEPALAYRELIDARRAIVSFSSVEAQELVELMHSPPPRYRLGRTAVLVSNDVAYGMMRMLQILVGDGCVMRPFRDLTEAERWLRH